jgi:hypothetical protein
MSSYTSISTEKLSRLIGTANAPALVDVRILDDFAADPRLIRCDPARDQQDETVTDHNDIIRKGLGRKNEKEAT